MRKYSLLVAVLLAAFLVGCGTRGPATTDPTNTPLAAAQETPSSTQKDSTDEPSPTGDSVGTTDTPGAAPVPAGPAECVSAEAEFPPRPGLPEVTADDNTRGSSDAPITLIEYSDFQ